MHPVPFCVKSRYCVLNIYDFRTSQRLANGHTVRYALAAWTVEPHLQFPTTMGINPWIYKAGANSMLPQAWNSSNTLRETSGISTRHQTPNY